MADSTQKEAFRKYLESAGVIDALTKGWMAQPARPDTVMQLC